MSHTASLELSRTLYEVSGWDDTDKWLHRKGNGDTMLFSPIGPHLMECDAPAYDLGYLLRKLPHSTYVEQHRPAAKDGYKYGAWNTDLTHILYSKTPIDYFQADADTPENALCQLAIDLFKSNILVKEAEDGA